MAEISAISWTHSTFNPWSGCVKVSAGCANCYAANLPPAMRRGAAWGKGLPRVHASDAYWNEPHRWNAAALKAGERRRVFCASTADVFEDRDDLDAARARLFALIEDTSDLDWLLTTKRADAIMRRVPAQWRILFPSNVWMLVSVEDQKAADARIPWLLKVPAIVRGLSMEPLLGPVDLDDWIGRIDHCESCGAENEATGPDVCPTCGSTAGMISTLGEAQAERFRTGERYDEDSADGRRDIAGKSWSINWIITGGESGRNARPMEVGWVNDIHRQAKAAGVAVHHKQMGAAWAGVNGAAHKKGGDPAEWPESFRSREFPEVSGV